MGDFCTGYFYKCDENPLKTSYEDHCVKLGGIAASGGIASKNEACRVKINYIFTFPAPPMQNRETSSIIKNKALIPKW